MIPVLIPAALALFGLLALAIVGGFRKIREARALLDRLRSDSPLYDQCADDLDFRPERPFAAGDETDVIEALRLVAPDEPDAATVERIWRRVEDELSALRGGA